jgi:hypothetical protein
MNPHPGPLPEGEDEGLSLWEKETNERTTG